ncbi:lipoprotein [Micromonospora sp. DT233]|uniref:lipoprotein n=1 Tax=Micromonospora sp. DT233 TaxID=3393432 RepID=UPI003CEF056D
MFRRAAVLAAALTLTTITGCAEQATTPAAAPSAGTGGSPVAAGAPWHDDVAPAAADITVGPKGSACPLPMTFSMPADWKVKSAKATGFKAGPALLLCEIDAKPAGNIGFLRVWRIEGAAPANPQATVDAFLAEYSKKATDQQYRPTKAGQVDSTEATWVEEEARKRAIVIPAEGGTMMLTLGGLDDEEFEEMLPAYQLAKSSVSLPK